MTLNVLAPHELPHVKTIDKPLPAWSDNPLCVFKRAIGTLTLGQSCEMTVAKSKITVTYCDGLNRKREPFDVSVDGGTPLRFAKKSQVVDTVTRQAEFLENAAELADSAAESPAEATKPDDDVQIGVEVENRADLGELKTIEQRIAELIRQAGYEAVRVEILEWDSDWQGRCYTYGVTVRHEGIDYPTLMIAGKDGELVSSEYVASVLNAAVNHPHPFRRIIANWLVQRWLWLRMVAGEVLRIVAPFLIALREQVADITPTKPPRPPVRYHGGKWKLANWIIAQFPPHICYVEPFGGGANVLLQKPVTQFEVYNDLDSDVVNFFDVLRERTGDLVRAIELTPYSREMQQRAFQPTDDPLEQALYFYIRCWQSFSASAGTQYNSGWRHQYRKHRGSHIVEKEWCRTEHLWAVVERLKRVQFENDDALKVIERYDTPETLFYCDPPYPDATRRQRRDFKTSYAHEMSDDDHRRLADTLHSIEGMAMISSYPSALYDEELYPDWTRLEKGATTNGNSTATEVLYLSPRVFERRGQLSLFEAGE